ncbi:hypothetical protein NL529_28805, partial [Klebsiella pneumoniae]|nr:hypothetical protein [Klebsiella pneumoniae]
RFIEPRWLDTDWQANGRTRIRIAVPDERIQRETEKSLADWLKSPLSLLFFKNIRHLRIGDQLVHWDSLGDGPVPDSERLALEQESELEFL